MRWTGILNIHGVDFASDLTQCLVEIDRRSKCRHGLIDNLTGCRTKSL
jgi:hypothetical protein